MWRSTYIRFKRIISVTIERMLAWRGIPTLEKYTLPPHYPIVFAHDFPYKRYLSRLRDLTRTIAQANNTLSPLWHTGMILT